MRIQWINTVVGVGAGGLDEVMEWQDENAGRTETWKTWTTWSRVGLCLIGYLGQWFNFFPSITAPLAQSEVTLVTKTIGKAIRERQGTTAVVTRSSHAAMPATPAIAPLSGRKVGWRPQPIGV